MHVSGTTNLKKTVIEHLLKVFPADGDNIWYT